MAPGAGDLAVFHRFAKAMVMPGQFFAEHAIGSHLFYGELVLIGAKKERIFQSPEALGEYRSSLHGGFHAQYIYLIIVPVEMLEIFLHVLKFGAKIKGSAAPIAIGAARNCILYLYRMERPLVSVVLCTYNGAKYLAAQVDSILRQTYKPLELIISDDASADGTAEALRKYENNPHARIFYQEKNIGLTRNFEFAAAKANGQMIAFSDQDDVWVNDKIEKLVNAIGDKPLVYSDSLLTDAEGNSLGKKLSDLKKMYSGEDSRGYILHSCVWGHGMLITRRLLEQSLPMPPEIHHDIWIVYQAFLHGGIKYLDEVLTYYRQHSDSTSQTLPDKTRVDPGRSRYNEYKKKLRWIELMQQHERPALQPFYQKLVQLYRAKEQQAYVFPLVTFMLRYRKEIFMYSKKGFASQLVEILKQGRGEKSSYEL
jgi:glycosyltransferase involved in cell wall biosynthesis